MDEKIKYAIKAHNMDMAFSKIVIGFSGGADSALLLHYFAHKAKEVLCVHVNHMIRGAEADRDEEFCRRICEGYGVPLVVYRLDIPSIAKEKGIGIEEAARNERYRVFNEELEKRGYDAILVAHNGDDNLESIIFNMARGAGLNGLSGIKPKNGRILRPLIYLSKDEIFSFCKEYNIEYVTDSTNTDTDYTRNYIRSQIVPSVRRLNPDIYGSIGRMTDTLRQDEDFILSSAESFVTKSPCGALDTKQLGELHPAVRARVFKLSAGCNLDYKSIRLCEDLVFNSKCGSYIDLSGGIVLKKERDFVHFLKKEKMDSLEYCYELYDGVRIEEIGKAVFLNSMIEYGCPEFSLSINKSSLSGKLYIRSRREGDRIFQGGMSKKIKTILCDKHIPSHLRDRIPIICDDNGIVAIGNLCMRDGCKYRGNGEKTEIIFYQIVNI